MIFYKCLHCNSVYKVEDNYDVYIKLTLKKEICICDTTLLGFTIQFFTPKERKEDYSKIFNIENCFKEIKPTKLMKILYDMRIK